MEVMLPLVHLHKWESTSPTAFQPLDFDADHLSDPDNSNAGSYGPLELKNKNELAAKLVRRAFEWAREVGPSQPLTVGVWHGGDLSDPRKLNETQRAAIELSP